MKGPSVANSIGHSILRALAATWSLLSVPVLFSAAIFTLVVLTFYLVESSANIAAAKAYHHAKEALLNPEVEDDFKGDLTRLLKLPLRDLVSPIFADHEGGASLPLLVFDKRVSLETDWFGTLRKQSPAIGVWGAPDAWPSTVGSYNDRYNEWLLFPALTTAKDVATAQACSRALTDSDAAAVNFSPGCDLLGQQEIQGLLISLRAMLTRAAVDNKCDADDFDCHYATFQSIFGTKDLKQSLLRRALVVRRIYMYVPQGTKRGVTVNYPGARPFCSDEAAECDLKYKPEERPWHLAIEKMKAADCTTTINQTGSNCLFNIPSASSVPRPCVLTPPYIDISPITHGSTTKAIVRTVACVLQQSPHADAATHPTVYLMVDLQALDLDQKGAMSWWRCVNYDIAASPVDPRTKNEPECNASGITRIPGEWLRGEEPSDSYPEFPNEWNLANFFHVSIPLLRDAWREYADNLRRYAPVVFAVVTLICFLLQLEIDRVRSIYLFCVLPPSRPTDTEPFQRSTFVLSSERSAEYKLTATFSRILQWVSLTFSVGSSARVSQNTSRSLQEQAKEEHRRLRRGGLIALMAVQWYVRESMEIRWRKHLAIRVPYNMFGAVEVVTILPRDSVPNMREFMGIGWFEGSVARDALRKKYPQLYEELMCALMLERPADRPTQLHRRELLRLPHHSEKLRRFACLEPYKRAEKNITNYGSGQFRSRDLLGIMVSAQNIFVGTYHIDSVVDGHVLKRILTSDQSGEARYRSTLESWLESGEETRRIVIIDSAETAETVAKQLSCLKWNATTQDIAGTFRWLPVGLDPTQDAVHPAFRDFAVIKNGNSDAYCLVTTRVCVRHQIEAIDATPEERSISFEGYVSVRDPEIAYASEIFNELWDRAFDNVAAAIRQLRQAPLGAEAGPTST